MIINIKSKFHENKDWNDRPYGWRRRPNMHQEQVPRKQGLKPDILNSALSDVNIKSKFHENKDWNRIDLSVCVFCASIKSKFHENKDWNPQLP